MPERAHLRALPEDERRARGQLRGVRREPRSRRCCFPWLSITRAPASTRPIMAVARGRVPPRTARAARARRATAARRRSPPKDAGSGRQEGGRSGLTARSQPAVSDDAARRVGEPLRRGERGRAAREHRDRRHVVLRPEDHRLAVCAAGLATEAAVERPLGVGAEVRPAELDRLARAEVGRERLDDVAAPETAASAAVPNDVTLSAVAWSTCCWRRARSRSVSDGSSRFSRIRE